MIVPGESLLKYDNPVLVNRHTDKKSAKFQARPLRVSPQQPVLTGPVPPPPKPKSPAADATKHQAEEILDTIFPPREWMQDSQLWVQHASSSPCTRMDVVHLKEQLGLLLKQRQARVTGICPMRRELYSQCFDELMRQVTINCAERGLLLHRVRDEIRMTIADYEKLYKSSLGFGMRKAMQAEQGKSDMEKRIIDLEEEKRALEKQVNVQKAKCDTIEKRETERRGVEERKHLEEVENLKNINKQLKAQLEGILISKK